MSKSRKKKPAKKSRSSGKERYVKIWEMVGMIPTGKVATYGQIAKLVGMRRGARIVGFALRDASADQGLPWHRVVNAKGQISFASGSPGHVRQRELLEDEGIEFDEEGAVDFDQCRWQPDLDELLWRPGFMES